MQDVSLVMEGSLLRDLSAVKMQMQSLFLREENKQCDDKHYGDS